MRRLSSTPAPLFLSAEATEPLLERGAECQEQLKRAIRLNKIEDLLATHKRNKILILTFLSIILALLFVSEVFYSVVG